MNRLVSVAKKEIEFLGGMLLFAVILATTIGIPALLLYLAMLGVVHLLEP